jgi:hypothetical protein
MTENSELYSTSTEDTSPKAKQAKAAAAVEETPLQKLTGVVKRKVERSVVLIPVPERPGVKIKISPNITQNQMKNWRKQAGEDTRNGMDGTRFACSVIGHTTIGILFDDEEVFDESGNELTFASPIILEMTGTTRPLPDCVKEFFGVDPHIEAAALSILDAAGYSDSVDVEDPTKGSSTN